MLPDGDAMRKVQQSIVILAILLLGLGLRLYHVTSPYLDHHSWRQTDTAAIARNFHRHGLNVLAPEVDWAGPGPSVAELELQITPLFTAWLYSVWGIHDWVGRLVPILFSLLAMIYFYRLVRLHADESTAGFATLMLAILPLNVFFTRVLMPESGTALFSIGAVYHLSRSRSSPGTRQYWLAVVFATLAFLSKLTALHLLAPLVFVAMRKDSETRQLPPWRLALLVTLPLAATAAYYGYMHASADIKLIPYAVGTDKWGSIAAWADLSFYATIFARLRTVVFTWLGLLLLLVGLVLRVRTRVFHVWLLAALGYVFVVARGNAIHSYYQMPLIPAGAFFIGLTLSRLNAAQVTRPLAVAGCLLLTYLSVLTLPPMYGLYAYPAYEVAAKLRTLDRPGSLVLYVPHRADMSPEFHYYADRKGWIIPPGQVSKASIEKFKRMGARYLVMPAPRSLSHELRSYFNGKQIWSAGLYLIVKL